MTNPEAEGRLLALLGRLESGETSRNGEIKGIRSAIGELARKFDKALERVFTVEAELGRHSGRLHHVEDRVVRLEDSVDEVVETTGQHELAALQKELSKQEKANAATKAAKTHWGRWVVQTLVGLLLAGGGAAAGMLLGN